MRWIFVAIVIISAAVRFYRIGEVPYGMNWDEVSIAYNAWSIATWHRDERANFMPLSFVSFGDYKPPGLIYLLSIPYLLFGLHIEWVRWASAIAGLGSVVLVYFIAKEWLQENKWLQFGAMLLMALSPWSITLSRVGYEQNTAFFLVNLGVLGLLKGLKKPGWWLFSILPIAASLYVFHTAKVFWLGFLPLFILIYHKKLKGRRWLMTSLVMLLLMIIPMMTDMISGYGATRGETLILTRGLGTMTEFLKNVTRQFSPRFWVEGWDSVSIRHSVPGYGVLTLIEAVFLVIGLGVTIKKFKQPINQLLMAWWIMGLMPALVTLHTPHALRSLLALTPSIILVLLGFRPIWERVRAKSQIGAKWLIGLSLVIYAWCVASYLQAYHGVYAKDSAVAFQYGYKEALATVKDFGLGVDKIWVSDKYGQPYIYVLAYNQIKPEEFLFGALNIYSFGEINWLQKQSNQLYLGTPQEIPVSDPAVVKLIKIPGTEDVVWVIART